MRKISPKVLKQVLDRKVPGDCERSLEGNCEGPSSLEHSIIYAGRQLDEAWAIVKICHKHHGIGRWLDNKKYFNKEINQLIALNYATDEELEAISKLENYKDKREYLRDKYPDYA